MIDFPSNPIPGVSTVTVGRKSWKCTALDANGKGVWDLTSTPDSVADTVVAAAEELRTMVGETPPALSSSTPGREWIDPATGKRYTVIQDANGSHMVEAAGFYYVDDAVGIKQSQDAAVAAQASAANASIAVAALGGANVKRLSSGLDHAYRAAYQVRPKYELYIPQFTSTAQLTNPTGLAIHSSGVGVVAAVAGVNGTGTIPLPTNIDRNLPFIFALKFEVNENTNSAQFQLCNANKDWWSGPRMTVVKQSSLSLNIGSSTPFNTICNGATDGAAGLIPAGTQFWLVCVSLGDKVATLSLVPDIASGSLDATPLKRTPVFQGKYNRFNYGVDLLTNVTGGAGAYSYGDTTVPATLLTQVLLQNASTSTRLIGLYVSIGEIAGPVDYQLGIPFALITNANQEPSGVGSEQTLIVPRDYGGPKDLSLVLHMHPNGNPGALGQSNSMAVVTQLYSAGYAQAAMTGSQNSTEYAGATSSNWGAPTGLVYRRAYIEYLRRNVPFLGRLMLFGMSMGGLNSLRYQAEYGDAAAIATVSGAVDLADSYNNRGFATIINNGFGAWYRSKAAANVGNDPASSPTKWDRINSGVLAVNPRYLLAPQNWKTGSAWASGTSYAVADVVFKPYTGAIAALAAYDPVQAPAALTGVPIKMWHGTLDTTIPVAQMTSLANAVNAAGGNVQTVSISGGGHLTTNMFDAASIQAFFDLYKDV